jgi:hypothetical protein
VLEADAIMEFLNSALECPLPSSSLFALTDFLCVQNAPVTEISYSSDNCLDPIFSRPGSVPLSVPVSNTTAPAKQTLRESTAANVLAMSSTCTSELFQAERSGKLAIELAEALAPNAANIDVASPSFFEPLLPTHVTEHLQEAMHSALMKVMAERDEAHAQLVSASVLHAHSLEQEKKKVERLQAQLDHANRTMTLRRTSLFDKKRKAQEEQEELEKLKKKETEMKQDTDAELVALCKQLSSEISSKTEAALEVIRLKESRSIEKQHEAEEKDALKNELLKMKELLALEKQKFEDAQRESQRWRHSYEKVAAEKERHKKQPES